MPPVNKQAFRDAFLGKETFATTLVTLVVDIYGTECFSWSPETLQMEIEEDFDLKLPGPNRDRLLCGINLLTGDDFYKSLPDFVNFCNILSGDTYDPRNWDPADAIEIAWGITEALLLAPPDDPDPFSEEITGYIGAALDAEGIINPPDVLKIAVRDINPNDAVTADFSDDPIMFDTIYDLEASKTEEINNALKTGLANLAEQLSALPLHNGSAKNAVTMMIQNLGETADDNSII